jgi:hypothetical protein
MRTNDMPAVEAKCSVCGFRVQVRAARSDPQLVGKCQRREGWERGPYLKPALAVARDTARKQLDTKVYMKPTGLRGSNSH